MVFTIAPQPLIKMVEMLGEGRVGKGRTNSILQLVARRGRVCVQSGQTAAEGEAMVWKDGQCTLSRAKLLTLLKTCRDEVVVTVEADGQSLRIGDRSIPVISYSSAAVRAGALQIFLATDLGVVSSRPRIVAERVVTE